jgi:hypothetical protein
MPLHLLLQAYSGDALATKLEAVKIDKAAVESAMEAAVPAPATTTTPTRTTTQAPEPKPITKSIASLAWVAGPVVGGCVLVALVGYWIAKRRSAQGVQGKDETMGEARGNADGRDGGTPREAWAANGNARAQAALN